MILADLGLEPDDPFVKIHIVPPQSQRLHPGCAREGGEEKYVAGSISVMTARYQSASFSSGITVALTGDFLNASVRTSCRVGFTSMSGPPPGGLVVIGGKIEKQPENLERDIGITVLT